MSVGRAGTLENVSEVVSKKPDYIWTFLDLGKFCKQAPMLAQKREIPVLYLGIISIPLFLLAIKPLS